MGPYYTTARWEGQKGGTSTQKCWKNSLNLEKSIIINPKKCPWTIWHLGKWGISFLHSLQIFGKWTHKKESYAPLKKIKVKHVLWPAQFSVFALVCQHNLCSSQQGDPFFHETSTCFLLTLLYSRWSWSWLTNRLTFPWFGRVKPFDESKTLLQYFRTFFTIKYVRIALSRKYIRRVEERGIIQ